ncbi:sperm acrosome-associated protein 9-like [Rana temporaria]|uniref:sperm acrosome-associated protein 9-like n=1 Tax=Rana temporaria TaxID=8407 RepID=UPI001AADC710|nr:sperm acrosome-associated protein 9-like [Rana temporaria]XP_040181087.1 sperm acrosome-associated protein 9-like [Rana temporaria]
MAEARQTLKALEQRAKLLQQQQNTFIKALERTRENAHDRIGPVRTLAQVRNYLDSHCNNFTDKGILTLFLDVCEDLAAFCIQLKSMQKTTHSEKGIIEQTIDLLNPTNDLSDLTVRYPHNVLNRLSCNEVHNYYAGVVSIVPIVLDNIRDAVFRLETVRTRASK